MKTMIIGGRPDQTNPQDLANGSRLLSGISQLVQRLTADGHEIVVCSPFEGSADYAALQGIAESEHAAKVEFHFPDIEDIRKKVDDWVQRLTNSTVAKFPHYPPETGEPEALQHAWLLSQLSALDRCSALISIGGRIGGSTELLLKLAHSRGRLILPLAALKGASARFLDSHRYEYDDILGSDAQILQQPERYQEIPSLLSSAASEKILRSERNARIFLSYAREQSEEANFVEMTLRRRGVDVLRDETSFETGHAIPDQIRESIFSSDIFLALWSADYACSPWCFDEIEIALDRLERKQISLWILQLDDTRIVPPRARDKLSHPASDREQMKSILTSLLSKIAETKV